MLVDRESGEIFLYSPIGPSFWEEGITAENVLLALDSLGGKRAIVRINSPGGSVDDGIAIYGALKRYKGGVDTVVDSLAASIASIIALAGENRRTAKGGRWMIHRAMTIAIGNRDEMSKTASMLDKHDQSLIEIYSEVMNLKPEEIESLLTAETWYTTQEAIDIGLSTGEDVQEATKPNVANWFKNAPAAIYKEAIEGVAQPTLVRNAVSISCRNNIGFGIK
jgi:ATP-dependent Clp protease, protease subunit